MTPTSRVTQTWAPAEEKRRVIVAEDDLDLRDVIAGALRSAGFEVREVENGPALLSVLAPRTTDHEVGPRPDLVVSDLRMPGLTGMSVLGGLRERDRQLPFILITAFGDDATHATARRFGATAILDKPFAMRDLVSLVDACLAA
jgi:DNA-binding response OmpR family regulator